ncbi:TPA: hypothetical protein ACH3X2_007700 [Trebouxia sp. C0005]
MIASLPGLGNSSQGGEQVFVEPLGVRGASAESLHRAGPLVARSSLGQLVEHGPPHLCAAWYHDGIQYNVRAFAVTLEDVMQCRETYLPEHNLEMIIYSATLGGLGQALRYAKGGALFVDNLMTQA